MKRAIERLITNPGTGAVVIAQPPNLPLVIFLIVTGVRLVLHPDGAMGTALAVIGTTALLVWAGLEITRGDSPFRRVLGAVVLVVTVAGIVTR